MLSGNPYAIGIPASTASPAVTPVTVGITGGLVRQPPADFRPDGKRHRWGIDVVINDGD
jgi:hypothetical protein